MTNEIIELTEPALDLKLAYQDLAREYLELRSLAMIESSSSTPPRIIQKNGGRLENQTLSDRSGKTISRYWITLPG